MGSWPELKPSRTCCLDCMQLVAQCAAAADLRALLRSRHALLVLGTCHGCGWMLTR